ncbi:phosphatase PAP2 family protein [Candidatus Uhrbacteria bacterium]|nr:phosphatase PAP2 family protein [Candidatus Uhrbacteria bacterium]
MLGEIQIIQGIQTLFQSEAGHAFLVFCSRWLVFLLIIPVAATGLRKRHKSLRHAAYRAAWAGVVGIVISLLLGLAFARMRPFRASTDIQLLIPPPASTYSFPSTHTSVAFAVAAALLYGDITLGLVALAIASGVAFGRVGTGVHYPSDIMAGVITGFVAYAVTRFLHLGLERHGILRRRSKLYSEKPMIS